MNSRSGLARKPSLTRIRLPSQTVTIGEAPASPLGQA